MTNHFMQIVCALTDMCCKKGADTVYFNQALDWIANEERNRRKKWCLECFVKFSKQTNQKECLSASAPLWQMRITVITNLGSGKQALQIWE